jgi:gamma-glutamylcyclotransferase (GGCT)/AIG2-like uncharacterized protein YtfP
MSGKRHKVFIYGTLLGDDVGPNIYGRKVKVFSARHATVEGKLYVSGVPYVVIAKDAKALVHGKVFEIDDDTLMEYDSIEGIYPAKADWVYERRKVQVGYDDGTKEEVWIYARKGYEGGELIENGQFDNWVDDDICPIPEDKRVDKVYKT